MCNRFLCISVKTSITKHAWVSEHPNSSKNDLLANIVPIGNRSVVVYNQTIIFKKFLVVKLLKPSISMMSYFVFSNGK